MHRLGCVASVLVSAFLITGCGSDPHATADEADVKTSASLRFDADWSVEQSGALVEGRRARIVYDAERLPQCRGQLDNGEPAWTITGFFSVNDAEAEAVHVAGFSPNGGPAEPVISLPEAGDLAVWFQVHNRWGCSEYDSDFGDNYLFEIEPLEE